MRLAWAAWQRSACQPIARYYTSSNRALPEQVTDLLCANAPRSAVVHGWVNAIRRSKHAAFIDVTDGSSPKSLQVVLPIGQDGSLTRGTAVQIQGNLTPTEGRTHRVELQANDVTIVGSCDPEKNPVQKDAPLSTLRQAPHMRMRDMRGAAMLRVRAAARTAATASLAHAGFTQVDTPIATFSDAEGAGDAFALRPPPGAPFFSQDAFATVSAQLHLEAAIAGVGRAYTLSPTFRAERSQTARHLAEFHMLEAEMAFVSELTTLTGAVETLIKDTIRSTLSETREDVVLLRGSAPPFGDTFLDSPWPRVTYDDAVRLLAEHHVPDAPVWGNDLSSGCEKWLSEEHFRGPVFVTDYPISLKPFYMRANANQPDTVACFDLLVPNVGELAGGSVREERLDALDGALTARGMDKAAYEWYRDLRMYGSVPHAGYGVGWERLIGWLTATTNLRDTVAFPRAYRLGAC